MPPDPTLTENAACAHLHVQHVRTQHDGGLFSSSWGCADCHAEFLPAKYALALGAERQRKRDAEIARFHEPEVKLPGQFVTEVARVAALTMRDQIAAAIERGGEGGE